MSFVRMFWWRAQVYESVICGTSSMYFAFF
ncbi:hypothetical protein HNQ69_000285 [Bartonella callosciuri]|uniref:Uncharacterized protein n=1 Tax=Bartonella callosciuri TaxID=686223 RepID=A0A840NQ20_9HYPH|nr:hypothetical protein [Bartonella callosciuri]